MEAPNSKIAVTLFNLREYTKTPEELDKTLERVRDIGYQAVQVSGCGLDPKIIKELLNKYELFCCATHEGMAAYKDNFDTVVEKMKTFECDFTALGSPGGAYFNPTGVEQLIAEFNELGKKFKEQGIKLGFHNHHSEFSKFGRNQIFIEEFYEKTNPEYVYAEIDVHWVTRGGGSPVDWIHRVKGRMPVVHFKDFAFFEGEPRFCEIGEGNLDWKSILQACEDTGVRWYSIEQDQTFGDKDIFESIKISYDNLRAMGVQ